MMSVRVGLARSSGWNGSRDRAGRPLLVLWIGLTLYSFIHAPVPGVNEPQQLGKAKHFWHLEWCDGDFFLESTDAHLFFSVTVGALNRWFSLSATAVIGRILAWLLLAVAWNRVALRFTRHRWGGVGSAAVFLAMASLGNLSGEWLVGGVEGKVFSYGFALLAFSLAIDQRWFGTGVSLGLAIAMHPVVGLWCVIAAVMSTTAGILVGSASDRSGRRKHLASLPRDPFFRGGLFSAVTIAATGIVPAFSALGGATSKDVDTANYIQVFYRLRHHLDPMLFRPENYAAFIALGGLAFLLVRSNRKDETISWLGRFVAASGLIALVGFCLGAGPRPPENMPLWAWRSSLLKFYPFRLLDVMLPLFVSLLLMRHVSVRLVQLHGKRLRALVVLLFTCALFNGTGTGSPRRPAQWKRDWVDVCQWIDRNLPQDALVMTPSEAWAFKWYSSRAEFVTKKDCPQDTTGIIEWNNRLNEFAGWANAAYEDNRYSREETDALHEQTGITHLVARHLGPFDEDPIYENETYRVQRIIPTEPAPRREKTPSSDRRTETSE